MRGYNIAGLGVIVRGYECSRLDVLDNLMAFESEIQSAEVDIILSGQCEHTTHGKLCYSLTNELIDYSVEELSDKQYGVKIKGHNGTGELSLRYQVGSTQVVLSGNASDFILLFALWLSFGFVALEYGVVSLHSSCVELGQGAVVFLGESGTGKSTHSRLWLENFTDAHLLNDDSPFVRVERGKAWVYGSPWSGKGACYRNIRREFKGAVRLSQAKQNKISRHNTLRALGALYPSVPVALSSCEGLVDKICDILSDVLSLVGVWHLEALPDTAAVVMSRGAVFNDLDDEDSK